MSYSSLPFLRRQQTQRFTCRHQALFIHRAHSNYRHRRAGFMKGGELLAAQARRAEYIDLIDHAIRDERRSRASIIFLPCLLQGIDLVDESTAPPLLAVKGQLSEERQ